MARRGGAPRPDLAAGPRKPFADDHALAVLAKTVLEEAPRLRELRGDVNRALDELVARMLQIDRENHPQDAAAVLAALEQSVERERAGDHGSASVTRVNIGFTLSEVGAYEEARDVLEAVLEVADRMELGSIGALARSNLGRVLGLLGELDRAWDLELEAIEAFAIQGDERLQNGSRIYLAWIRELTGDLDAAERYAREAVERTGATPTMRAGARPAGRRPARSLSAPRSAERSARGLRGPPVPRADRGGRSEDPTRPRPRPVRKRSHTRRPCRRRGPAPARRAGGKDRRRRLARELPRAGPGKPRDARAGARFGSRMISASGCKMASWEPAA